MIIQIVNLRVLIDICGVDYPEREARFEVVYHLLSVKYNSRIRVKVAVDELTPIDSVDFNLIAPLDGMSVKCGILYGVFFSNHPDLTTNLDRLWI